MINNEFNNKLDYETNISDFTQKINIRTSPWGRLPLL